MSADRDRALLESRSLERSLVPLRAAIDYAGLFPPAALPMAETVASYARYRAAADGWALGRLIVPAGRLVELLTELDRSGTDRSGWRLSVTLGADLDAELALIAAAEPGLAAVGVGIDCIEARTAGPDAVARLARGASGRIWYAETGLDRTLASALDQVAAIGGRAKIRMGGVTAEAFPATEAVIRFLLAVAARRIPFKATAGLHHPIRGDYPLTYAADAPRGTMYGYLNLLIATGLAEGSRPAAELAAALETTEPRDLLADGMLAWRGDPIPAPLLERIDARFDGFGSCSFREPIDELLTTMAR